jgi:hypothetical protein
MSNPCPCPNQSFAALCSYISCLQHYSNHDIVTFLESIGASFGACQNAYTSADETVYTLMVPTADGELLDKSIAVLSEFAARIRCVMLWFLLRCVFVLVLQHISASYDVWFVVAFVYSSVAVPHHYKVFKGHVCNM